MTLDTSYTNQDFQKVGTRPPRPDGLDKVTGRARYGADATAPGQLTGMILRSPHPHARIKKIDASRAEKLKGVKAVVTSADLPDLTGGDRAMLDILENCMARERALYDGHAVAAVAAIDTPTMRVASWRRRSGLSRSSGTLSITDRTARLTIPSRSARATIRRLSWPTTFRHG